MGDRNDSCQLTCLARTAAPRRHIALLLQPSRSADGQVISKKKLDRYYGYVENGTLGLRRALVSRSSLPRRVSESYGRYQSISV